MPDSKEILVIASKLKDVTKAAEMRADGELVQAVSDKIHEMLEAAIARAKANGRATVKPYDL